MKFVGDMRFTCEPIPPGVAARRPYVQAFCGGDTKVLLDGSDLLPFGQEEMLQGVRSLIAKLPASADISEVAKQPVIVRTYAEPNQSTILVMNTSPWKADAQITLDVTQSSTLQPLSTPTDGSNGTMLKTLTLSTGQQPWNVSLGPYELQAVRIPAAGTKAVEVQARIGGAANAELAARLADLTNRDLSAPRNFRAWRIRASSRLVQPAPSLGGACLRTAKVRRSSLDANAPNDGKTSLYLRSTGEFAAIESEPFAAPTTGQLAMTVFARGKNNGPNSMLTLAIETETGPPPPCERAGNRYATSGPTVAVVRNLSRRPAAEVSRTNANRVGTNRARGDVVRQCAALRSAFSTKIQQQLFAGGNSAASEAETCRSERVRCGPSERLRADTRRILAAIPDCEHAAHRAEDRRRTAQSSDWAHRGEHGTVSNSTSRG